MSPRQLRQRDARIAELDRRRNLSRAERAELQRLTYNRDTMWRTLPRRIAGRRADLRNLEAYADEIGLGPC